MRSNSSLLINLSKAMGTLVISYKKVQRLSGTTSRICNFLNTLDDILINGKYVKKLHNNKDLIYDELIQGNNLFKGKILTGRDFIKF